MLISTRNLRLLPIKPHHLLPQISHFTQNPPSTIDQISTLIKHHPNWHQNTHLKSLSSHLSPESAHEIISIHRENPQLCLKFFKFICTHSTYCYNLNDRFQLLNLIMRSNLFAVLHKAIIVVIKGCSNSCSTVNEGFKLIEFIDEMRRYGFHVGYPCYSVLLMCLSKLNMGLSVFSVYKRMVSDGFVLSGIDYRSLVNGLCKSGLIRGVEMFVVRILKLGFDLDVHVCSSLVLGYCRIGDVGNAWKVFDVMRERNGCGVNEVTFTVLIHGLCETGWVREAFRLKEEMVVSRFWPSTRTYTVLVKALSDSGLIDKALCLFDEMGKKGCDPNEYTYTILIDALCREGKIEEANGMFRKMVKKGLTPNTVTFNVLINGYCKEGRVVSAFELLSMMEKRNSKPNIRTYNELMEGLCRIGKPYKAMTLLRKVISDGLLPETLTYNILVDGFCKEGQLDMAFRILKSMDKINFKSDGAEYTTLIDRLSKEGKLNQANGLLGLMMKKGIDPDEVTFTALSDGYCKNGKIGNAVMILDIMVWSTNITLTGPHIFNTLIDAFSKDSKMGQENAMVGKMLKHGVTPSVVTYTILIDGLCRTGDMDRALEVFELMKCDNCSPNVYTYTVLIDGFCQNGRMEEAVKLFRTMRDMGVSPNVITYTILIKAYVRSSDLECVFEILSDMINNECQPNFETFSVLFEGLIFSKSITNGSSTVFKEMGFTHAAEFLEKVKKSGVGESDVYSFLIMGLYKVGRILEGGELFQEMVKNGYFPDISTCSQILEHLCRERKYDDCAVMMKLMFDHGLIPSFPSFCLLVHGLRNEKKVKEVHELIYDLLSKAGIEDRDGVSTYMEFLVDCDEHDECLELLRIVEELDHQERPII